MRELLQPISEEQENECLAEIGYSRCQLHEDLLHIREWLKQQHHLPPSRLKEKDEMLTMYLTACKGRLDTVKSKLDAYYTFRSQSAIFANRDPLQAQYAEIMNLFNYAILPRPTARGERVGVISVVSKDSGSFIHLQGVKKMLQVVELFVRMDSFCVGAYVALDCQNVTLRFISKLKLRFLRDIMHMMQNVLPLRVSGVIFVNVPYYVNFFVNNFFIPLAPKKLQNRIYVTSNGMEDLSKFFDIDLLPKEYGGQERSLKELTDAWLQKEISEREWFLNELSEHTDESKRISS